MYRNKVITVGKIIQNEQALHEENTLLKEAIENLEERLAQSEAQQEIYRDEIADANDAIQFLQGRIIEGSDTIIENEKAKNSLGFYGYAEVGTPLPDIGYNHFVVGIKMVNKKTLYSFTVNPVNTNLVYQVGVGFKLW